MNYKEYYKKLFKLKNKMSKQQILLILHKLKYHKTYKIFHVGGTNGKGSLANYLEQGFIKKYKKVGLFTSPHILKVNERIKINDELISDKDLYKYSQKVLKITKNISFTTLMYIICLLYFADNKVDIAILEVGIGGKYDDTSSIHGEYGVVVSIGIDHEKILGHTIQEIAKDKAGIMHKNMTFFIPNSLEESVINIFVNTANKENATLIKLDIESTDYRSFNKQLASQILKTFDINIKNFQTPFGRTTTIKHNKITHILDVAHNYPGIKASLEYLEFKNIQYQRICLSLSHDKNVHLIKTLFPNDIYVYQNTSFKAMKINDYSFGIPITNLKRFIDNSEKSTLFIGSFYFISDIMAVLNE